MGNQLSIGNVFAVRAIRAQDGHLLVRFGSEHIYSHKAIGGLELDCGILLEDVREAFRVHGMELLGLIRHGECRLADWIQRWWTG